MSNQIAQRRITGQKTAPAASTPLKTPYRLGDVLKNGRAAKEFSGKGEFTELSSSEHSAFAFIVTGMAEETSHNAKCKATAEFIVRACNSHDVLISAMKQMRADALNNNHGYIVDQIDAALSVAGEKP